MSDAPSNDQLLRTTLIGGILFDVCGARVGIICVTTSLAGLVSARAARKEAQVENARELAELRDQLRHREVLSVVAAKRARALRAVGIGCAAVSIIGGALVLYWRWRVREKLKDLERERGNGCSRSVILFLTVGVQKGKSRRTMKYQRICCAPSPKNPFEIL